MEIQEISIQYLGIENKLLNYIKCLISVECENYFLEAVLFLLRTIGGWDWRSRVTGGDWDLLI